MLVMIGKTDLTKYIENNSYKMESGEEFIEWKDGNNKKHRVYVRNRVKGSFNVICNQRKGMKTSDFLSLVEANKTNNILTITCLINNKGKHDTLSAYVKIMIKKHTNTADIFTVEVEER